MASRSLIILCCLMACVGSYASGEADHEHHEKHEHEKEHEHEKHEDEDADHEKHEHDDEHEHEHEHEDCTKYPWEWSGIFEVKKGHFAWNAARKQGTYADPSMRILLLSAADAAASSATLKTFQTKALALWSNTSWTDRPSGSELTPGVAYNLKFDQHSWISVFPVDVESSVTLVIFTQHSPAEFENGFHFFKTEGGADVEAVAQGSANSCHATVSIANADAHDDHDNLAMVILGAFVTCTPTLLGVLFVSCAVKPRLQRLLDILGPCIDSFASGVLISAAVFLLLPEALHLASAGHDDEVAGTWTWGTSILLGWLTCSLIHHSCSIMFAKQLEQQAKGEVQLEQQAKDEVDVEKAEATATLARSWASIAGPVIFGDFFHNLTDGFVIGAAFQNCSESFAWKLVAVTVCHELPQEIADLFILINDAGMRWHRATLANFFCSLSTVFGAIITYGMTVGSNEEGYILAYGAGVYLFIAMTELGPKVVHLPKANYAAVAERLIPFALGCIAIGLVLLSHEHCEKASSAGVANAGGAHAGHAH